MNSPETPVFCPPGALVAIPVTITPAGFRAVRKRIGLSQADLAEALGITRSHVSRMETGDAPIAQRTALALMGLALMTMAMAT